MDSIVSAMIALCVVLLSAAMAMPTDKPVDLSTVINRTTCPMVEGIDFKEDRIPQRIKVLKCAEGVQHCSDKVPEYECCGARHEGVRMACVEVQDNVQVFYPAQPADQQYQTLSVSVGCLCVMERDTLVAEDSP